MPCVSIRVTMSLINQKGIKSYKPFEYPQAYQRFKEHEQAHWLPEEVSLGDDVKDWKTLTEKEQVFIKNIFLLFTQNDVQVGAGYDVLLRVFKPTEVQMMLRSQANRESVHMDAYSLLLDTLGFDEDVYSQFLEVPVMATKIDYIESAKVKKYEEYRALGLTQEELDSTFKRDIAKMLAVYGAFTEGVSLFAQFALLLNYQRFNLLKGMCQIVSWSIKDEEMHVQNNAWIFKTFIEENPNIWDDSLKFEIYEASRQIVDRELAYIDYVFDNGHTKGLVREDVKNYIKYTMDRRLLQIGLKANYRIEVNPLVWLEEILNTVEFTNFFENRVTEYVKASTQGSWLDIKESLQGALNGNTQTE